MSEIVLKSAMRSRYQDVLPGVYWEYFIIWNPYRKVKGIPSEEDDAPVSLSGFGAMQVTKEEAYEFIRSHGLVSALKTKDGQIWDSPNEDFKKEYKIKTKDQEKTLDNIWNSI